MRRGSESYGRTLDEDREKVVWIRTKGASLQTQLCHLVMENHVSKFDPFSLSYGTRSSYHVAGRDKWKKRMGGCEIGFAETIKNRCA